MLKQYKCPNADCKMFDQRFPVMIKVDGWFYQVPEMRCMHCHHTAEEIKDE